MNTYIAELEQDPFDVHEFVERIAWRATADKFGTCQNFDANLLHQSFKDGIAELQSIQDSCQKRCERLEIACKEEEKKHWLKVSELKERFKDSIVNFQAMDNRLDTVATKVHYLGAQLECVNTPRSRAVEAYQLLKQFGEFLSPQYEPTMVSYSLSNKANFYEDADVIYKLHSITQDLPSNKVFDRARKKIAEKYAMIEEELIEEFDRAYKMNDKTKMREISSIMQHFKGYDQCVNKFIESSLKGLTVNSGPMDHQDIFSEIVPLCEKVQSDVRDVFHNSDQVMWKFLVNIYHGKLKEHCSNNMDIHGDPEKYLNELHCLYLKTTKLSNQLSTSKIQGADPSLLNKSTRSILSQYLDSYNKTEISSLKDRCVAILNRYYESKNHQKKHSTVSSIQDIKAKFSRAKNINITGIANINVNIGPLANINITVTGDPLPPGETLLSEEVAISILHEVKQALNRCQSLSKPAEVADVAVEIFDLQLQYLCIEHLEYAIDLSLNFLPSSEPKAVPDLYFFDIVRQCNAICHLIEKQFVDSVLPLVASTPRHGECIKRKREIMEQLELKLNNGLERSLTSYIGWIKSVLVTEQKKTDFKPENDMGLEHGECTSACSKVCRFVKSIVDKIQDCLDGENVIAVSNEFGMKFHKTILEHFQQFQYSLMGAMVAITDVNAYSSTIMDKKNNKLQKNDLVGSKFDELHALCNLLIVAPENLKQVANGERIKDLDKSILANFVQLRSDYRSAKLTNHFR